MRRFSISAISLAAAIAFLLPRCLSQSAEPSSSCPCTLQGTVVDSVSGQAVNRALVRLTGNSRAVLTDAEGRFQFEGLASGSVTVLANKPGYLGMSFGGSRSPSMRSVQLPVSHSISLKLTPESIITGQVTDEDGAPLEGLSVNAFVRSHGEPLDQNQRHRTLTDDEGKFRIAGLHPGSYFLQITHAQGPVLKGSRKSDAPMGYPTVFYPAVSDLSSAVPLKLLPGKTLQANFSLKREPFVQLSGTVSGFSPQERVSIRLLDSSGIPEDSQVTFDWSSRSFHTKWIPPGRYTLMAESSVSVSVDASRTLSFASLHVNATSSLSELHLSFQRTLDVPVVIHGLPDANGGDQQAVPPFVALLSKDLDIPGYIPRMVASSGSKQTFFRDVIPGTYELFVGSEPNATYYPESATWGSTDLLHSDLVLESSGSVPPIEVVVRDDGATLNGTVSSGDTPIPAQVVFLSEKLRKLQIVSIGSNGRFEISGLAPGTYRVFAVDSTVAVDYTDSSFLQKISTKIQEVTLSPKQSASVDLEVATVEE